MNRKLRRKLLSVFLIAILVAMQPASMLYASEIIEPGASSKQDIIITGNTGAAQEDVSENVIIPDTPAEEVPYGIDEEIQSIEEPVVSFEDTDEVLKEAPVIKETGEDIDPEEVFWGEAIMRPTYAQEKTAEELEEELKKLDGLTPGVDYVENEAVLMADTREEAEKAAKQYGAEVVRFSYGIATLVFPDGVNADGVIDEVTDSMDLIHEAEKALNDAGVKTVSSQRYMGSMEDLKGIDEELARDVSEIEVTDLPETPIHINFIDYADVDPASNPLYGTSSRKPYGQWFHMDIDSEGAWALGATGSGITVAVIDTGVDRSNNDLSVTAKTVNRFSSSGGEDEHGHGTHCTGIVGARDNGIGGLGVAPDATMISIRAASSEGQFTAADEAEAVYMAIESGADIISMSFGGSGNSAEMNSAIQQARKRGILCVASAGNNCSSTKQYPACYNGVLVVGSYEADGTLSDFSNFGPWVHLAGPGGHILATMPDSNVTLREKECFWDIQTSGCSYGKLSGTSMSTPAVAGVAALIKSMHPDYDGEDIKEALLNSAPDLVYSFGGHSVKRGVNAKKAVSYEVKSSGEEKKENKDFLYNGIGNVIKVKAGKSVGMNIYTSLGGKITFQSDDLSKLITVNGSGVIKVNKKAPAGHSATVTSFCGAYKCSTLVKVIPADETTAKFTIFKSHNNDLSTDKDSTFNTVDIYMAGGDPDNEKTYKIEITGKGGAYLAGGNNVKSPRGFCFGGDNLRICTVVAQRAGKIKLTVIATDGSNYKQSLDMNIVSPMESVDITYAGVPIRADTIQMAKGASLQLKAVARSASDGAVSGKVKYTWSGPYVSKSGKVSVPKNGADFYVTVDAVDSSGNMASKTLRIWGGKNKKIVYMGYAMKLTKGAKYYNSIESLGTIDGDKYAVGGCYGFSQMNMPDMSQIGLSGPYGFTEKSAQKFAAYDYSDNQGQYVLNIKGPSVTFPIYGDYGMKGFTPGKKGSYKFIFTALDGSGKTFTVPFKVTEDQVSNSISVEDLILTPGELQFKK